MNAIEIIEAFESLKTKINERWAVWVDVYYGHIKNVNWTPCPTEPRYITIENGMFCLTDETYCYGDTEHFNMELTPEEIDMPIEEYRALVEAAKDIRRKQYEKLKEEFDKDDD